MFVLLRGAFRQEENGVDGVVRNQGKGQSRESMGEWLSSGCDKLFCAEEQEGRV